MVKHLSKQHRFHPLVQLVFLICCVWHLTAYAAELRDPTQLPNAFFTPEQGQLAPTHRTSGPVLQLIMLSDNIRAAIINGKKINLNEHYQQAKLIALTENSATLRLPDGKETVLKMPHIGIKTIEENLAQPPVNQPLMATKAGNQR